MTTDGCEGRGGSAFVRVSAYGLNVRVQCTDHCRFCSVRESRGELTMVVEAASKTLFVFESSCTARNPQLNFRVLGSCAFDIRFFG